MFYVFILATERNGTLYVGQTDNLRRRAFEHRSKNVASFTRRYEIGKLVWFESFEQRTNAFRRERRIKEWRRTWKLALIEGKNPDWLDLYDDLNDLLVF